MGLVVMAIKLTIADQDGVDAFGAEADAFLRDILGHEEALITDDSHISDFIEFGLHGSAYEAAKEEIWRKIEVTYGIDVRPEISILAILRKIHWRGKA